MSYSIYSSKMNLFFTFVLNFVKLCTNWLSNYCYGLCTFNYYWLIEFSMTIYSCCVCAIDSNRPLLPYTCFECIIYNHIIYNCVSYIIKSYIKWRSCNKEALTFKDSLIIIEAIYMTMTPKMANYKNKGGSIYSSKWLLLQVTLRVSGMMTTEKFFYPSNR